MRWMAWILVWIVICHAEWKESSGSFDGSITTLHWSPSVLLAGTGYGIYRSVDRGQSWTRGTLDNVPMQSGVRTILLTDSGYIAATEGPSYSLFIKSSDSGKSWTSLSRHPNEVQDLLGHKGKVYAATADGIHRSSDAGKTWILTSQGAIFRHFLCFAKLDTSLFAGTYGGGVSRSDNDGDTWAALESTKSWSAGVLRLEVLPPYLFASVRDKGVFRSEDRGDTWTLVLETPPERYVRNFAVHGRTIFAGTADQKVLQSETLGETWRDISEGRFSKAITALAWVDTTLFVGTYQPTLFEKDFPSSTTRILENRNPRRMDEAGRLFQNPYWVNGRWRLTKGFLPFTRE